MNASTPSVTRQFAVTDHIGGIVLDATTSHLVGNTWGSRALVKGNRSGRQVRTWDNRSFFLGYQECRYVPNGKIVCGGVVNLPQSPSAGGAAAGYELGGLALIDIGRQEVLREVPLQQWSTAGRRHAQPGQAHRERADAVGGPRQR